MKQTARFPGTRHLLVWHLSRSGKSKTAETALKHALINRFACLGRVPHRFLLRSDNGLMFPCRSYTALVKSYGLQQVHHTVHA
jgi:putative transposase